MGGGGGGVQLLSSGPDRCLIPKTIKNFSLQKSDRRCFRIRIADAKPPQKKYGYREPQRGHNTRWNNNTEMRPLYSIFMGITFLTSVKDSKQLFAPHNSLSSNLRCKNDQIFKLQLANTIEHFVCLYVLISVYEYKHKVEESI